MVQDSYRRFFEPEENSDYIKRRESAVISQQIEKFLSDGGVIKRCGIESRLADEKIITPHLDGDRIGSEQRRRIAIGFYREGLSKQAIAEKMKISRTTVCKYLDGL